MKNADRPAFPLDGDQQSNWIQGYGSEYGMTKREEFIKAAMQGLCANPEYNGSIGGMAREAIARADATLEEMER